MRFENLKKEKRILFLIITVALAFAMTLTLLLSVFPKGERSVWDDEYKSTVKVAQQRNLLLLGRDRASGLTDVMMLVSLDGQTERLTDTERHVCGVR